MNDLYDDVCRNPSDASAPESARSSAAGSAPPPAESSVDPAESIILGHVVWAIGSGLIPVPVLDWAAVTGIQLDLLNKLARHHGVAHNDDLGKKFVTAMVGSTLARMGASAIKAIPGVGTVVGSVSMAVLSGASTYAIGRLANQYFAAGDPLSTENLGRLRAEYDSAFEEGRKVVERLRQNVKNTVKPEAPAITPREAAERLMELKRLLDAGVLTEAEYQERRAPLVAAL